MKQVCIICGETKRFRSAFIIVDGESERRMTGLAPVCRECRTTKTIRNLIIKIMEKELVEKTPSCCGKSVQLPKTKYVCEEAEK